MPEAQRCVGCKRPLSRYNPDPLCASCLHAARHRPDGADTPVESGGLAPVWLWDSPPMRRALSRPDPGAMLVIFRAATGLSQFELADIMDWSQSTVSLIERAAAKPSMTSASYAGSRICSSFPGKHCSR